MSKPVATKGSTLQVKMCYLDHIFTYIYSLTVLAQNLQASLKCFLNSRVSCCYVECTVSIA